MKKMIVVILLCSLCALTGCNIAQTASAPTQPVRLPITVVCGAQPYAAAELLTDDDFRAELEKELHISIDLSILHYSEPFEKDVEISFTGGLITDNCLWMVPMSTGYRLEKIGKVSGMAEPQYGQVGATSYSYVFSGNEPRVFTPVLLVNKDIIDAAGISSAEYSPEGIRKLLTDLKPYCTTPLTVYGAPCEIGFSVLLNLFSMAPTGGHEFYLEDDYISFDKISTQARQYLLFIRSLYEDGMIPADCVLMNEYAARTSFLSRQTAFAVFPNEEIAQNVLCLAEADGIRAAAVTIPSAPGKLDVGIYNRPVGMISFSFPYTEELLAVYQALDTAISARPYPKSSIVPLSFFSCDSIPAYTDPIADLIPEIGTLYNKHLLDRSVISPYYSQILIGSLPVESIESMNDDWLNLYVPQNTTSPDYELSGNSLLQYINGWHYRAHRSDPSEQP